MFKVIILATTFFYASIGLSSSRVPECLNYKNESMQFNENDLLYWRDNKRPNFSDRAFIRGIMVSVLKNKKSHTHFEIDLDMDLLTSNDRIEVIYNNDFGQLPRFRPGSSMVVCGDFIVEPDSKFNGIVHWTHMSPRSNHLDGFLLINSTLTGQVDPHDRY